MRGKGNNRKKKRIDEKPREIGKRNSTSDEHVKGFSFMCRFPK